MSVFDKWDKEVDTEGLLEDIKGAENDTRTFEEVPSGEYEVKVEKLELKPTKKAGDPMVTIWYKIVEGDYKDQYIFQNQVITRGFQIHIVNEVLRALTRGEMDIDFKNYSQYNDLLLDVHEEIADSYEYALAKGENDRGYPTFEIIEVFELE